MEPGYKIEHFVVIEKIGQGGQAAVWSAYDERLRRTVAIKTIDLRLDSHVVHTIQSVEATNPSSLSMALSSTSSDGRYTSLK